MINSYYNEGEEEKRRGASNLNGFMAGTRWWRCCVIIIWQPCAPCVTEYRMMNDPLSRPGPAWWIFRPPKGWRTDSSSSSGGVLSSSPPHSTIPTACTQMMMMMMALLLTGTEFSMKTTTSPLLAGQRGAKISGLVSSCLLIKYRASNTGKKTSPFSRAGRDSCCCWRPAHTNDEEKKKDRRLVRPKEEIIIIP